MRFNNAAAKISDVFIGWRQVQAINDFSGASNRLSCRFAIDADPNEPSRFQQTNKDLQPLDRFPHVVNHASGFDQIKPLGKRSELQDIRAGILDIGNAKVAAALDRVRQGFPAEIDCQDAGCRQSSGRANRVLPCSTAGDQDLGLLRSVRVPLDRVARKGARNVVNQGRFLWNLRRKVPSRVGIFLILFGHGLRHDVVDRRQFGDRFKDCGLVSGIRDLPRNQTIKRSGRGFGRVKRVRQRRRVQIQVTGDNGNPDPNTALRHVQTGFGRDKSVQSCVDRLCLLLGDEKGIFVEVTL